MKPEKKKGNWSSSGDWGEPWPLPDEFDETGVQNLANAVIEQVANDYRDRRNHRRALERTYKIEGQKSTILGRCSEKCFFCSHYFSFWAAGTSLSGDEIFQRLERDEDEKDKELYDIWQRLEAGEILGPYAETPWWLRVFTISKSYYGHSPVRRIGRVPTLRVAKRRIEHDNYNRNTRSSRSRKS